MMRPNTLRHCHNHHSTQQRQNSGSSNGARDAWVRASFLLFYYYTNVYLNKDRKVLRYHYHNDATVRTMLVGFFYIIDYFFLLINLLLF